MDNKLIAIVVLSLTAVALTAACLMVPQQAQAQTVVQDRDYTLVTAPTLSAGTALYISNNRTGQIAVLTYDQASRTLKPRVVRSLAELFEGAK